MSNSRDQFIPRKHAALNSEESEPLRESFQMRQQNKVHDFETVTDAFVMTGDTKQSEPQVKGGELKPVSKSAPFHLWIAPAFLVILVSLGFLVSSGTPRGLL